MKHHNAGYLLTICSLFGIYAVYAEPNVKGVPNFHIVNDQVLRGGRLLTPGLRISPIGASRRLSIFKKTGLAPATKRGS
jgi:hypothetical protein